MRGFYLVLTRMNYKTTAGIIRSLSQSATAWHNSVLHNNPYSLQFENIELLLYDEIGESRVFQS